MGRRPTTRGGRGDGIPPPSEFSHMTRKEGGKERGLRPHPPPPQRGGPNPPPLPPSHHSPPHTKPAVDPGGGAFFSKEFNSD